LGEQSRKVDAAPAPPLEDKVGRSLIFFRIETEAIDFLRELVPAAARVAVLVNPAGPTPEITLRDVEPAARSIGLQTQVVRASTRQEIDAVFATFVRERPDILFVGTDPYFTNRRVQLVHLATRHAIPGAKSPISAG
jgi:putative tryptophan/tyrosine transport system substrate-binding protein